MKSWDTRNEIDRLYASIVTAINLASDQCLPHTSEDKSFLKPYWDKTLKELHSKMKNKRRICICNGHPRGSNYLSYRNYKAAKCIFRKYHRKCAENYMKKINEEIDSAAEVDSGYFWRLVNRRKVGQSSAGSEMKFNGNTVRAPEKICQQWGQYYSSLYSEHMENKYFDNTHYVNVKT